MNHPYLDSDQHVCWSKCTVEQAKIDIKHAINKGTEHISAIKKRSPSYQNTVMGIEMVVYPIHRAWNIMSHLNSVNGSDESRACIQEILPELITFTSSIFVDSELWEIFNLATQDTTDLTDIQKRHVEEIRADFEKNGALLGEEDKKKCIEIDQELAKLTQDFSNNVLADQNAYQKIITDERDLDGLPTLAKQAAFQLAKQRGVATDDDVKWLIILDLHSTLPILKYAHKEELRKEITIAANQVGRSEQNNNFPIIKKILQLRKAKAHLLGYKNFPNMVLERRMVKNGENALQFVEDLFQKSKVQFDQEVEILQNYKRNHTQTTDPLHPWDVLYYIQKIEQELYEFDENELRPYFSLSSVLDGFFNLAHQLYGVQIKEVTDKEYSVETWHSSVKVFDIFDTDESYIGRFYADLFPRPEKRSGAWMNPLHNRAPDSTFQHQIGLICANFTPPIEGNDALLLHREVQTFFHEMGHLLHHMFGDIDIPSLNGTSVAWDFVELPSQIMENWCWEKDFLQNFAKHNETNEVIDEIKIQKLQNKKNFMAAYHMMRQLRFGMMDLQLHIFDGNWDEIDMDAFISEKIQEYQIAFQNPSVSNITQFQHLFSDPVGYAAGYYSYKWAEVLDADAFGRFQNEGILSRDVGIAFRKEILSKGNSVPADQLFFNFMGRSPDPDALLKRVDLMKR